jgi:competence protein ComEA
VVVAALVTAVALMGTVVVLGNAQPAEQVVPVATPRPTTPAGTTADATTTVEVAQSSELQQMHGQPASSTSRLVVHVVGDVADPGVVRLDPGSRVIDAVQAAGGALPGADLSTVNLARLVADGEQVRVGLPPDDTVAGVVSDAGQSPGVVNVNQAGVDRLVELPGIGPVLAGRIVTYRDTNGPFVSVDQLLEVPGIGPSILESIHERIQL